MALPEQIFQTTVFRAQISVRLRSQCATHGSGSLLNLGQTHPVADYALCEHTWTKDDQEKWHNTTDLPIHRKDLDGRRRVLFFTISWEYSTEGPSGKHISTNHPEKYFNQTNSLFIVTDMKCDRKMYDHDVVYIIPSEELLPPEDIDVTVWKAAPRRILHVHYHPPPSAAAIAAEAVAAIAADPNTDSDTAISNETPSNTSSSRSYVFTLKRGTVHDHAVQLGDLYDVLMRYLYNAPAVVIGSNTYDAAGYAHAWADVPKY